MPVGELSSTIAEGREFGPYVIDKELGSGGMASVWRAHRKDHQPETLVVLKTMLPHISRQSQFVDMFVREALMSAELSHPNLINVYDVGLLDNQYFIEMEYVAGRTVRQVLRRLGQSKTKVELPLALAAMADCCDALAYIHDLRDEADQARFLVHRDVSPEN
ncbi:MAG: protein kinase, partial [Myxococcota bacterium]